MTKELAELEAAATEIQRLFAQALSTGLAGVKAANKRERLRAWLSGTARTADLLITEISRARQIFEGEEK